MRLYWVITIMFLAILFVAPWFVYETTGAMVADFVVAILTVMFFGWVFIEIEQRGTDE